METLLVKGRWLQTDKEHDYEAQEHMHMYRQVLETYDPQTKTVLLSKKGSRRLKQELNTPDKRFSLQELIDNPDLNGCRVRPSDWHLF